MVGGGGVQSSPLPGYGVRLSPFPVIRLLVQLHNGDDDYFVIFDLINHAMRETVAQTPSGILGKGAPGVGEIADVLYR
jgi:hypothetical protein